MKRALSIAAVLLVASACHGDPVGGEAAAGGGTGGSAGAAGSGGTPASGGTAGANSAGAGGSSGLAGAGFGGVGGGTGGASGSGGCQPSCAVELAPATYGALDLAVDASEVWFVSFSAVAHVAKTGGTPSGIASGTFEQGIGVDTTHVYVFAGNDSHPQKIPKTGGSPLSLGSSAGGIPLRVGLNGGYLYWAGAGGPIQRVTINGGSVEQLSPAGSYPSSFATDGQSVWWSNRLAQTVVKHPLAGGGDTTLGTGLLSPGDLVLGAGKLYVVDVDKILAFDPDVVSTPDPIVSALPDRIEVDASYVYWTSSTEERVARAPLAGGSIEVVASGLHGVGGLALDAANVYFTDEGAVYRAPKGCCVTAP